MIIDCDTLNDGCNGGTIDYTYMALSKFKGIMLENDYSYTGRQSTCKYDENKIIPEIRNH